MKAETRVQVVGMAPEDECEQQMFVEVEWKADILAVPLIHIEASEADAATLQAIADLHYWVDQGYEFG